MAGRFSADEIGPVAWRRLCAGGSRPAHGRVLAVLAAAFYVELGCDLISVATRRAEPGPLTVLTTAAPATDWRRLGIRPGQPVAISASRLTFGAALTVDLRDAGPWIAPPAPATVDLASGLKALDRALGNGYAPQGFGRLVLAGYAAGGDDLVGRRAAELIAQAVDWLGKRPAAGGTLDWARQFVGLGPGLTPAGDDFLGGMLMALTLLGEEVALARLWAATRPHLAARTNRISAALLAGAAEGHGSASLHGALTALLGGGPGLETALAGLARIGHSSGWDALAGAIAVLKAAHETDGLCAA